MAVHTVGGVIGPGETAMLIVPREDLLIIEARVLSVSADLEVDRATGRFFPICLSRSPTR